MGRATWGGETEGTRVPVVAPSRGRLGQGCCSLSSALKQILLRLSEGRAPPQPSPLPSTALCLAQKMTCLSLSLSLFSLPPASSRLCSILLSPPRHPPRVDRPRRSWSTRASGSWSKTCYWRRRRPSGCSEN